MEVGQSGQVKLIETLVNAGRVKDKDILMKSSSGGAFTVISDFFLDNGDAIVCTLYNYESHAAEFRLITEKSERDAACGSKYMQSKPGDVYKEALSWLKNNPKKRLLFVGMGCQAEGFRHFTERTGIRDRVWIVDIICHGSPSPRLWREYAASLEKKYGGFMSELSFKDKRNGWNRPTARVCINEKEILLKEYVKVFYNRCALRPSCHVCPFATTERKTDMTIGDYWHIEEKIPDFYDADGNSLFLIHTNRGEELFISIKSALDYRISNTKDCWQENLERPTPISEKRTEFWRDYQKKGIGYIMKKYGTVSLQIRIKNKVKKIIGVGGGGYKVIHLYSNLIIMLISLKGGQHDELVTA